MSDEIPHIHVPRQHRDGKEPWCPVCELNAEMRVPKSRIGNHPAGKGINAVELAKKWFDEDEQEAQDKLGFIYEKLTWEKLDDATKLKLVRRVQEARGLV